MEFEIVGEISEVETVAVGSSIRFAVCFDNGGYPASLELHKIYRVLPDEGARPDGELRIVDEAAKITFRFVLLELPQDIESPFYRTPSVAANLSWALATNVRVQDLRMSIYTASVREDGDTPSSSDRRFLQRSKTRNASALLPTAAWARMRSW